MFGYGCVPPIWVGFWVRNSLNNGSFLANLNMGGFFHKLAKNLKICSFPPKFIIKVGMTAIFGN